MFLAETNGKFCEYLVGWPRLAARPPPSCSLHSLQWDWGENQKDKSGKNLTGQDKDSLVSEEEGGKKRRRKKKQCKVNHYLPPADWSPANSWVTAMMEKLPTVSLHDSIQSGIFLLWQLSPLPKPLPTPNLRAGGQSERQRSSCCCSSTVKYKLKHQCVINTFWSQICTAAQHELLKEINFIPAKPNTHCKTSATVC